jgi:hypothetical protein
MTVFLLTLCFAVVIWSAFNHLRYLGIDADYLISGGRRLQSLCNELTPFTLKSCLFLCRLGMVITEKN